MGNFNLMRKILFVPQTKRNYLLLYYYAQGMGSAYESLFIRTTLFGENNDILSVAHSDVMKKQIVSPDFLCEKPRNGWRGHIMDFVSRRKRLLKYVRQLNPCLIVVGIDSSCHGRWFVNIGKKLGIPTVSCQEGAVFAFAPWIEPMILKFKRILVNQVLCWLAPGAMDVSDKEEFKYADYSFVWGEFTQREIIRRGLASKEDIYVIGDPRQPIHHAQESNKFKNTTNKILFVDVPAEVWPKGVCNIAAMDAVRTEIINYCLSKHFDVIYKLHPLSSEALKIKIEGLYSENKRVQLVTTGVLEDLLNSVDCAITFPSTAIYSILAYAVPLLQIQERFIGFGKILWDPVERYGAGFTIHSAMELEKALSSIHDPGWINTYMEKSRIAAEDVLGRLDGCADERFAMAVETVLERHAK